MQWFPKDLARTQSLATLCSQSVKKSKLECMQDKCELSLTKLSSASTHSPLSPLRCIQTCIECKRVVLVVKIIESIDSRRPASLISTGLCIWILKYRFINNFAFKMPNTSFQAFYKAGIELTIPCLPDG